MNDLVQALKCMDKHKQAVETWEHGKIEKVWRDSDNCLCIQYEDGAWWHYKKDDGEYTWW